MKAAAASLVVLTLNVSGPSRVHQGWPTRREAIVSRLKVEGADAAAFQDIWRPEDLQTLAEGADHPHRAYDAELGVAVTSRVPIESSLSTNLGEGRGTLRARISVSGREVDLYSTRLEEGDGPAAARRLAQLFRLAEFIRAQSGKRPFALMGDLAASPDDPEMRLFMDLLETRDLCVLHGDEVCGRTLGERRVDYILIPYSSRAPREAARTAFTEPLQTDDEQTPFSSHFGLRAKLAPPFFRLKPTPRPAGRLEALSEIAEVLETAKTAAARREAETGWLPLLGTREASAARLETANLTAVLEEVRSALIRAQRPR